MHANLCMRWSLTIQGLLQGGTPAHDPGVDRRHDEGACPAALVLVVSGQQLVGVVPLPAMHQLPISCMLGSQYKRLASSQHCL